MHTLTHSIAHSLQKLTNIFNITALFCLEMKEIILMSKRRRVYSVETGDSTGFTSFCVKYLTCLLQALMHSPTSIKMSGEKNEEKPLDFRKRVRFEVDSAMLVTVSMHHFKWTQNLKQKLDSSQWSKNVAEMPIILVEWHHVPSAVNYLSIEMRRSDRKRSCKLRQREMEKAAGEREEVRQCIDSLRELVLIGDEECSMEELMDEVASYVRCLQFQVGALRSLLSDSDIRYD